MTAKSGRDLLVRKNGVAIAGLRTNSTTLDGSPVDVTDKSDGGFRRLANFAGVKSMEISVDGVWKANTLGALAFAATATGLLLDDVTLINGNGDTIAGDFYLANYTESGGHEGEVTFTATLQSSGAWTTTAAGG
jgi:predicted secreted protein